jgi:hypothetical protein
MPPYKANDLPEETRVTVRLDRDLQARILEHQDRLARRSPGVSMSVASSIRNLIETGSRTWRATEKTGLPSPAALLAALTDEGSND